MFDFFRFEKSQEFLGYCFWKYFYYSTFKLNVPGKIYHSWFNLWQSKKIIRFLIKAKIVKNANDDNFFFYKLAIPRSIRLLLLFCKLERYYRSNLPVHVLSKTRLSRSTNFSIFFKRMLRIFLPANIFHKRFWNVNIAACKLMKLNSSYDSSCEFATFCPKF